MTADPAPLVDLRDVSKDYRGLRPLRIQALSVSPGQRVAIVGFDAAAAETFVNLITGATLPDQGVVRVFGRDTKDIEDADGWLAFVDRFGIVSARAVLLDRLTLAQNMAMPFTLDVEPVPEDVTRQVHRLAAEVGLAAPDLQRPVADASPDLVARVRLARAVALGPEVVLLEHPTAMLAGGDPAGFAADLLALARARRLTTITITADATFAGAVADRVLTHEPGTGVLKEGGGWRRWLGL